MENRYMNRTLITIVCLLLLALLCYGTYDYCKPVEVEETIPCIKEQVVDTIITEKEDIWVPTKEDIAYQDSMYTIIQNTQSDVDTIKVHIEQIIERLDDKEEADWSGTTQGN